MELALLVYPRDAGCDSIPLSGPHQLHDRQIIRQDGRQLVDRRVAFGQLVGCLRAERGEFFLQALFLTGDLLQPCCILVRLFDRWCLRRKIGELGTRQIQFPLDLQRFWRRIGFHPPGICHPFQQP